MKILITGINGMLGSCLKETLKERHEIFGIDLTNTLDDPQTFVVDLTNYESTYKTITRVNPDIVVHTAALTDVDKCEIDPDLAYRINAISTRNVAVCCQRFDAALVYISTDYVFSEERPKGNNEGYTEYDEVKPLSVYARSKYEGERYVSGLLNKYFIARSSWLYGASRKNFVTQVADSLKDNKTVNMAEDLVSSPTYVKDLAHALAKLMETQLYGLYHVTNSGFGSRYEVAKEIAKLCGSEGTNIRKVSLKDLKLPAVRPSYSAMRNYVWQLNGFRPLRKWQDAIKEFLKDNNYL